MTRLLLSEGWPPASEVSLVLCDDAYIHTLNSQHMGEDRPTDVLSFPQMEDPKSARGQEDRPLLGDIVISLETAQAQARERGVTLQQETELLLAHGLLHLLGYDHATPEDRQEMWARQESALQEAPT
ncbi:MAG TPA: rRNA maturation RNase YbeY [Armatimonadota bacterium]